MPATNDPTGTRVRNLLADPLRQPLPPHVVAHHLAAARQRKDTATVNRLAGAPELPTDLVRDFRERGSVHQRATWARRGDVHDDQRIALAKQDPRAAILIACAEASGYHATVMRLVAAQLRAPSPQSSLVAFVCALPTGAWVPELALAAIGLHLTEPWRVRDLKLEHAIAALTPEQVVQLLRAHADHAPLRSTCLRRDDLQPHLTEEDFERLRAQIDLVKDRYRREDEQGSLAKHRPDHVHAGGRQRVVVRQVHQPHRFAAARTADDVAFCALHHDPVRVVWAAQTLMDEPDVADLVSHDVALVLLDNPALPYETFWKLQSWLVGRARLQRPSPRLIARASSIYRGAWATTHPLDAVAVLGWHALSSGENLERELRDLWQQDLPAVTAVLAERGLPEHVLGLMSLQTADTLAAASPVAAAAVESYLAAHAGGDLGYAVGEGLRENGIGTLAELSAAAAAVSTPREHA